MEFKRIKCLGADWDGTGGNWARYFCKAMNRAIPMLARHLQLSEVAVGVELGVWMRKYRTHEYRHMLALAFGLHWTKSLGYTLADFEKHIQRPFWKLLLESMDRYLTKPYVCFRDMLDAWRNYGGVETVNVVSNGPVHMVARRIACTRLNDGTIDRVYGIRFPDPDDADIELRLPSLQWLEPGNHLEEQLAEEALRCGFKSVVGLPVAEMKPSPFGLRRMMQDAGVKEKETAYIGDAPSDVVAGMEAGCAHSTLCRWASYDRLPRWQRHTLDVRLQAPAGGSAEGLDHFHVINHPLEFIPRTARAARDERPVNS